MEHIRRAAFFILPNRDVFAQLKIVFTQVLQGVCVWLVA